MKMRFTTSIREAFNCLMRLQRGDISVTPMNKTEPVTVERPEWCEVVFFNGIEATKIRKIKRVEPTLGTSGYWTLERIVRFFLRGSHIATLVLAGCKYDGDDKTTRAWIIAHFGQSLRLVTTSTSWEGPLVVHAVGE